MDKRITNPRGSDLDDWVEDQHAGVSATQLAAAAIGAAAAIVCDQGTSGLRTIRNGLGIILGYNR